MKSLASFLFPVGILLLLVLRKASKKSGKKSYEVPAKIGFDAESPAPLIGVKIALTVR